ncbi:Npun_F0494 family protein [Iningainema tapete]|uniref:Uncharacterized protein n=1 Tax=Iningainema tapete BLCC-T55 TaxID=2748662 RepID=A0A8J6XMU5_9CYAN|nr:Npun_F0494 family protein [Iningainema tapete]MBD2775856.1 hypothetical protein [Iningainema tapete BLCC-T55]
MSTVNSPSQKQLSYPSKTQQRAKLSLICSPFNQCLFEVMRNERVALSEIAGKLGVENGYTKHQLSELAADNALVWLINVGVLRREVDGQGITDSFRLTPLGRLVLEKFQSQPWGNPSWRDRLYHSVIRWLRIPF